MYRRLWFLAVSIVAVAAEAQPWRETEPYESEIVRVRDFHDAASRWTLTISPRVPVGGDHWTTFHQYLPASYRMLKDGALAWESELPFTLYRLEVMPDGAVVGYAYETGREGGSAVDSGGRQGDLLVAAIGLDGQVCWKDERPRCAPSDLWAAMPLACGLTLRDDVASLYVELSPGFVYETWRYRVSTGERLPPVALVWTIEDADRAGRPWFVATIPETTFDIIIARHMILLDDRTKTQELPGGGAIIDADWGKEVYGAEFMIVDPEGRAVWEWARPGVYGERVFKAAGDQEPAKQDWTGLSPAVSSRKVTVPLPDGKSLSYTLVPSPDSPDGWELEEAGPD